MLSSAVIMIIKFTLFTFDVTRYHHTKDTSFHLGVSCSSLVAIMLERSGSGAVVVLEGRVRLFGFFPFLLLNFFDS